VKISEFQKLIEDIYFAKDSNRGVLGTFAWFVEEVGELSRELRSDGNEKRLKDEFADVLAWLSTLASLAGIDLEAAAGKYSQGCPKCHQIPCVCNENRSKMTTSIEVSEKS
jgi:NTP pyrophosphatase (non-canonical NTP hydrolase)